MISLLDVTLACELYGYENIEIIERLQLKYLKYKGILF